MYSFWKSHGNCYCCDKIIYSCVTFASFVLWLNWNCIGLDINFFSSSKHKILWFSIFVPNWTHSHEIADQIVMNLPLIYVRLFTFFSFDFVYKSHSHTNIHLQSLKKKNVFHAVWAPFQRERKREKLWPFVVWHQCDYNPLRLENLRVFARLSHFWSFRNCNLFHQFVARVKVLFAVNVHTNSHDSIKHTKPIKMAHCLHIQMKERVSEWALMVDVRITPYFAFKIHLTRTD